jgi:hypothetical protein
MGIIMLFWSDADAYFTKTDVYINEIGNYNHIINTNNACMKEKGETYGKEFN